MYTHSIAFTHRLNPPLNRCSTLIIEGYASDGEYNKYKFRYQIVCILKVCVQRIFNIQTARIHVIPAYFVLTKMKIIN